MLPNPMPLFTRQALRHAFSMRTLAGLATIVACSGTSLTAKTGLPPVTDEVIVRGPVATGLDRLLSALRDSGFNGAVLVAVNDTVILSRGYGWTDSTRTDTIAPATRFVIASISKQFTAAAILELGERGRLRLTDSIGKFFHGVPASARGITLHHLLSHTSGLPQRYAADGRANRDSAVAAVLRAELASPPGTRFDYTNDGYSLLAAVVEIVSGQPFDTFVLSEIAGPAGLIHTAMWGAFDDRTAASAARIPGPITRADRRPNWGFRGATGMWSTTTDLYRWLLALRTERVLTQASVTLLMHPHVMLDSSRTVGYGWFASRTPWGRELWTRGTEGFGHNAVVRSFPERKTVVIVASNTAQFRGAGANRTVSDAIVQMLFPQR
ncbi:MAG: beta-lactamase family protein [Gemmatimonadota bacterium]|nr:beta-lactamase family protein [Gemmatimonadota bacterium]